MNLKIFTHWTRDFGRTSDAWFPSNATVYMLRLAVTVNS